jgi:hypothetical protein
MKIIIQRVNEMKNWSFEGINKIIKLLIKVNQREIQHKLTKFEAKRGILQQIQLTSRGSLGNILKTYVWKI